VARAGTLGLPLTIAIIGGQPERFVPLVELYREAAAGAGHDPSSLPVTINTHASSSTSSSVTSAIWDR